MEALATERLVLMDNKLELLQQIKRIAKVIRNDEESGYAYLMGYLWACLTEEEKIEAFNSFNKELVDMIKK